MQPTTSWHLIGCQFERARDSSRAEDMACSKLTVLMLVITASLCTTWRFSTCSFQNICWWTQVCDKKGEKPVQRLLSVPPFLAAKPVAFFHLLSSFLLLQNYLWLQATSLLQLGPHLWSLSFQLPKQQVRQHITILPHHTWSLQGVILSGLHQWWLCSSWQLSLPSPYWSECCPFPLSVT